MPEPTDPRGKWWTIALGLAERVRAAEEREARAIAELNAIYAQRRSDDAFNTRCDTLLDSLACLAIEITWPVALGRNLAIAGALCQAHLFGHQHGEQEGLCEANGCEGPCQVKWKPGCGRSVP